MKIKLVRHGESEWNVTKTLTGWENSPLTQRGIGQAEETAKKLKGQEIDLAITSDLGRASQTAEITSKMNNDVGTLKDWLTRGRYNGSLEGKFHDNIEWSSNAQRADHLNAVSADSLHERAKIFVKNLKNIVIVSYHGVLNSLISIFSPGYEYKKIGKRRNNRNRNLGRK